MKLKPSQNLQKYHTLAIPVKAKEIVVINTQKKLAEFIDNEKKYQPRIILGFGSNSVFLKEYPGYVIIIRFGGYRFQNINKNKVSLQVNAGAKWNNLAWNCLKRNIWGTENLVEIPGSLGAAIIQNIGAYGQEIKNLVNWVEYIDLKTKTKHRLYNSDCSFGYRDSIFKDSKKYKSGNFVITRIELILSKKPSPILNYPDLRNYFSNSNIKKISILEIAKAVKKIRKSKIPPQTKFANAGSFFKNIIVDKQKIDRLIKIYPTMPYFKEIQKNMTKYKIPTGWLIENIGLRGYKYHSAEVSSINASILGINKANKVKNPKNADDLTYLIDYIKKTVYQKYQLKLEPEVQIYQ